MRIPLCSGEEAIPAKKTKTLISAAQISQISQTEVEQVGHTSNHKELLVKLTIHSWLLVSSPSKDGDQLSHVYYDEGPSAGGRTGSQSSSKSSSKTYIQVPHPNGGQGGSRTPAVPVTSQTREGTNTHTSQVSSCHQVTERNSRCVKASTFVLSVCPFRPAAGPDILPPWKQGGYVTESTHTIITSVMSSSITQRGQEQQVAHHTCWMRIPETPSTPERDLITALNH